MRPSKRKASISPTALSSRQKTPRKLVQSKLFQTAAKQMTDMASTGNGAPQPPDNVPGPETASGDLMPHGGDPKKPYILRKYYPDEMTNTRAGEYINGTRRRPMEVLDAALKSTHPQRNGIPIKDNVIHWFRSDLRLSDNRALNLASQKALQKPGTNLIAVYLISPEDYEAHVVSPARVDFILRALRSLREDLARLHIPLYIEVVQKRVQIVDRLLGFAEKYGASHIYANMEYEVDELRRDAKLVNKALEKCINFTAVHDTCTVHPGELSTKSSGRQFAVFTPWFKAWLVCVYKNPALLQEYPKPSANTSKVDDKYPELFTSFIPETVKGRSLDDETKARLKKLFPATEAHALARLEEFIETKISSYADVRNAPALDGTSSISVYLAAGLISSRTCMRLAKAANEDRLEGKNSGIASWISEVAWREFYKHVLVNWPYICMNKPFKPEYTNIEWNYSPSLFNAWTQGKTGYPLVDAAMRHLSHSKFLPNRCRMVVASFLAKDLLLDWRMGEKYFMENLIDCDFASNNGGWGFCSSAGVDPQPYFRIFNPVTQSKKFDPEGEYIRRWVPELQSVLGDAVHEPWKLGEKKVKSLGYVMPVVKHDEARKVALERYKAGLGRDTA